MRVLVACEFSGVVRNAFIKAGHDAISCDLLPCEQPDPYGNSDCHYQGDILELLRDKAYQFDLMIAHPPCTDLAVSGAAWFKEKIADGRQQRALNFVRMLMDLPPIPSMHNDSMPEFKPHGIPRIAIENPISVISSKIRKPDQIIQPWMFGHETTKATCLWLKGLPKLVPTNIVSKGERQHYASGKSSPMWHAKSGGGCGHQRSITFQGIADGMAAQWGIMQ